MAAEKVKKVCKSVFKKALEEAGLDFKNNGK